MSNVTVEEAPRVCAPWTEDQVESLNGYQQSGVFHPFTCGHMIDETKSCREDLVACEDGWTCPRQGCGYRQTWAHGFMADWQWLPQYFVQKIYQRRKDLPAGTLRKIWQLIK